MLTRKFLTPRVPSIRHSNIKWLFLFLACMMNFGMDYCLDNPQALQGSIQDEFGIDNADFNFLYTAFAIPNIIMPFFGGLLIDTLGVRKVGVIFSLLIIIGQGIVTFSAFTKSYLIMVIGRVIFGLGGDTLLVVQACLISKWFMSGKLSMAMALAMGVSTFGSSVNSILSPIINDWGGGELWIPLFCGCIVCIFSFICLIVINFLDLKADKQEEDYIIKSEPSERFSFQHLKELGCLFYLLLILISVLDAAFYSFMANANSLLVSRFGFDQTGAGQFVAIVYATGLVFCPLFGWITDRYGNRVYSFITSCLIFTLAHIFICYLKDATLGITNTSVLVALYSVGIHDSIYSAVMWPSVSIIVEDSVMGSAYGIVTSLANILAAVFPIAIGCIHDETINVKNGYFWTEAFLAIIGYVSLLISIWIWFEDKKTGSVLQTKTEPFEELVQVPPSPALLARHHVFPMYRRRRMVYLKKKGYGPGVPLSADVATLKDLDSSHDGLNMSYESSKA